MEIYPAERVQAGFFLMNRFDFVVGNPPWLTYAAVSNGEYQGLLRQLSDSYAVTPVARANMPHLEIAAIFLAHAVNYFLKAAAKIRNSIFFPG
jgi:hypothetical protein